MTTTAPTQKAYVTGRTFVVHGGITHEVTATGTLGFVTKCATRIPATAPQYVKVERTDGGLLPTRGWACAGCFEPQRSNVR
jgi:hypothetical protein